LLKNISEIAEWIVVGIIAGVIVFRVIWITGWCKSKTSHRSNLSNILLMLLVAPTKENREIFPERAPWG
jgi:hypothetical protein